MTGTLLVIGALGLALAVVAVARPMRTRNVWDAGRAVVDVVTVLAVVVPVELAAALLFVVVRPAGPWSALAGVGAAVLLACVLAAWVLYLVRVREQQRGVLDERERAAQDGVSTDVG